MRYYIVPTPPFTFVEGLGRLESFIYSTASPALSHLFLLQVQQEATAWVSVLDNSS